MDGANYGADVVSSIADANGNCGSVNLCGNLKLVLALVKRRLEGLLIAHGDPPMLGLPE